MKQDPQAEELITLIRLAHDNSDLDLEIQEIFINAVKRLRQGNAVNYVAYRLVNGLSDYYLTHIKSAHNPYVNAVYNLASQLQISYRKFLWHP